MKKLVLLVLVIAMIWPGTCLGQDEIKIGFLNILSGRLALFGRISKQGADLAIDEINKAGGIGGRRLVGIFVDTEGKAEKGVALAAKLVNEDRVQALLGIVSSGVAEKVSEQVKDLKVPLIITTAMTNVVTGEKCNPYTFRVTWTTDQCLSSAGQLAAKTTAKTWTTVGPDYLFGYESWDLFQKFLGQNMKDVRFLPKSQVVFAPLTTSDWEPHIKKIMESGADGVLVSLFGGNAIDFVRQANAMNFFGPERTVLMSVAGSMDVILGLGAELPPGVWIGTPYWFEANRSDANRNFVAEYQARFHVPPSYAAETAYCGVRFYAEAVKRAGSTSPEEVIRALRGMELDLPVGKVTMRPGDHQALFDVIWGKASEKVTLTDRRKIYRSWDPIVSFSPAQVLPSPAEAGCVMK